MLIEVPNIETGIRYQMQVMTSGGGFSIITYNLVYMAEDDTDAKLVGNQLASQQTGSAEKVLALSYPQKLSS